MLSSTATGLQNALNNLHNYSVKWALEINIEKTKIIIFSNKKKKEEGCTFKNNDIEIEVVTSFNYLGIVMNSNGKFTSPVKSLKDKVSVPCLKYTPYSNLRKFKTLLSH